MRFGRLTLIEEAGLARSGNMRWRCRCSCGKESIVFASSLRRGTTVSCGCFRKDLRALQRKEQKQSGCTKTNCLYYNRQSLCCNYFDIVGHTRTWLHRDEEGVDINNPCREYEPRPEGYKPDIAFTIKRV